MKYSKKSTLPLIILAAVIINGNFYSGSVDATVITKEPQKAANAKTQSRKSIIDITTGWKITNYFSSQGITSDKVFKEGVESEELNQRMVMSQFANIGDANLTAERIIPMKAGRIYNLDLVFAQLYNLTGTGYIDFNGERFDSTNDPTSQVFKKTVAPTQDMNYKIEVHFNVPVNGNGYFKIGFDKDSGGVTEEVSELASPVVSPIPEAGTRTVSGTADPDNRILVKDETNELIGEGKVDGTGHYTVTTNRNLHYREVLKVTQKNEDLESSPTEVTVTKTTLPGAPSISTITDEDKVLRGTSEPYTTVHVDFGTENPTSYEVKAGDDGKYNINLNRTFPGQTKISAYAVDEAGNKSNKTESKVLFARELEVTIDSKISSIDKVLSGTTSRPQCEVKVHFGDRVYETKSDDNGKYTINFDQSYDAGTEFEVTATHTPSHEIASLKRVVLPRVPNIPNLRGGVEVLEGEADPFAVINLNLESISGEKYEYTSIADASGKFTIELLDQAGEKYSLKVGDKVTFFATLEDIDMSSETITTTIFSR